MEKYLSGPSMVTGETKSMMSLESPILITVCRVDQFDLANEIGFSREMDYYQGRMSVNQTYISWMGLEGNLTTDETITNLFVSEGEQVWFEQAKGNISLMTTVKTATVLPNGQCEQYEGPPHELISPGEHWKNCISLYLNGINEGSVYYVYVSDPSAAPKFQLPKPLLYGGRIGATTDNQSKVYYYNLVLTEKRIELDDGSCVDYPDAAGHDSYADCVEEENRKKILPVLGCMPPWLSGEAPCNKPVLKSTDEHEHIQQWLNSIYSKSKTGFHYEAESCSLPCTQISVHTTFQDIKHMSDLNYQLKLNLFFDEIIKVERVVLAYGTVDLLVEVGSCLGLWLGLSVVGVFDIIVLVYIKIRSVSQSVRGGPVDPDSFVPDQDTAII